MKKYLIAGAVVLALDQATKALARAYLGSVSIIGDFFTLTYITNTGAGFSLFQGQNLLLATAGIVIIGFLLYFFKRFQKNEQIFVAIIIGGALGNLIDRLILGHVVDFIAFSFWPTFNIADCAVSIGALSLIYMSFKN